MDREGGVVVYGGRFRAVAYVARRPWATVFRAVDEQDGGVVALSVVSPGAAPGDDFAELLAEEVGLLDGLDHPNLLPVLAHGHDQGAHYVAEEWVEGPTLAEVVAARGPLPAERVAVVLAELADGLAVAHAAGVVHGGPAPADVWMVGGPGGVARLHGLALLRAVVLASAEAGLPPAGDRPYLAPERLAGAVGAPGADLYGVGALAFEALCGVPPFGRDGRADGEDPPWPSDLVGGIPEGFDDVVLDLLEADPSDRYHDALELREELEPFLRRRNRTPSVAGVAAGAAAVGRVGDEVAGDLLPDAADAPPRPEADVELEDGAPEALVAEPEVEASDSHLLAPDGQDEPQDVPLDGLEGEQSGAGPAADEATPEAWQDDELWEEDDEWEPLEAEWEPDPAVDWQPEVVTPVVEWEPDGQPTPVPPPPAAPGEGDEVEQAIDTSELDEDEDEDWDEDGWDESPDGVEPQRWEQASVAPDVPGWVSPTAAPDDGGWERWAEEGDDVVAPYDADDAVPHEWQPPVSSVGGSGGGRRMNPLLGAGIVAIVLLVIAAGLFAFDRLRGDDGGGSSEDAAETTSTTAATTSTTAATTTTVVGTGPLTEVPNVVGMGLFEAAEVLTDAGFISLPERRIDPAGQQGVVVEQDPPAGMVPQGSTVKIVFTEPEEPPAEGDGSTDTTAAPFG
jgi:serine/threonine-protein kinase